MPEIKEVSFTRKFNLGGYQTMDVGLVATIGPGDNIDEVFRALDKKTVEIRNKAFNVKAGE